MLLRMFCAGLLALFAHTASAAETMSLSIGGTTLQAPIPDGYVRASERVPTLFATSAAALPPSVRLVETLVAESDLKPMLMGQPMKQPYLQVQVLRDAERLDFTAGEWTALQPVLVEQLGGFDMDRYTKTQQSGMSERMSAATGVEIEITYGEVGKPAIYAKKPTSLHYTLRLPITAQVNGEAKSLEIEAAGAAMLAGSKMVMANAYAHATPLQPPFAVSRAIAEAFVSRMQLLNAAPAAQAKP
ncbi:MAG: hypothetical protein ABIO38_05925 [Luteimonas sp.]